MPPKSYVKPQVAKCHELERLHEGTIGLIEQILLPDDCFVAKYLDPFEYDSIQLDTSPTRFDVRAYRGQKLVARLTIFPDNVVNVEAGDGE